MNKQNSAWGIALITVGIHATLDQFFTISELVSILIFGLGGLVVLGIYFTNRADWTLLIPVYVLWVIAGILAYVTWVDDGGKIFPAVILFLIALPFLVTYLRNKKDNWWALIPAYVLLVIIPVILLEDSRIAQDYTASYILTAIALPFLLVYYRSRENWWALIPAYVLLVVGLIIVPLSEINRVEDEIMPAIIMFAIALPFTYVYYRNKTNRWALIPAGITGLIGLILLINAEIAEYIGSLVMIGFGLWLLLRKPKQ